MVKLVNNTSEVITGGSLLGGGPSITCHLWPALEGVGAASGGAAGAQGWVTWGIQRGAGWGRGRVFGGPGLLLSAPPRPLNDTFWPPVSRAWGRETEARSAGSSLTPLQAQGPGTGRLQCPCAGGAGVAVMGALEAAPPHLGYRSQHPHGNTAVTLSQVLSRGVKRPWGDPRGGYASPPPSPECVTRTSLFPAVTCDTRDGTCHAPPQQVPNAWLLSGLS